MLAAAAFRLVALPSAPPGMTHDEADHGLTAWAIVNGARDIYFTVGYGREPLYDYVTALVMAGTGPTILAPRLTSAYLSLLMIAATYAWARRAFGAPVALLAAAGLAVGFWPVVAGRQALRSIALPALFAGAVLMFWRAIFVEEREEKEKGRRGEGERRRRGPTPFPPFSLFPFLPFLSAGILLGLTFYTYIPARGMWLAFPALAAYLALVAPPGERRPRRLLWGTALTLGVAFLVAAPLLLHLWRNPGLEVRIDELNAPLDAATVGEYGRLLDNALGALRLFTIEGDQTWRYNIPGKPFLGPVTGALFCAGLVVAGWLAVRGFVNRRNRVITDKAGLSSRTTGSPGAFLALVWLALGFAPVLVTGPGLSTTQAIGALPVLYVFPALAMAAGWHALRRPAGGRRVAAGFILALIFFAAVAAQTARDYFGRWANAPEVRVQYETTMVTALRYLDERGGAAAVSTITPGRFHTPAVALLTLRNPAAQPRWFDGRESLLFPAVAGGLLLVPGFTPIPAALQPYLAGATPIDELPMRPNDLDRPVRVYRLDRSGDDIARTMSPVMAGSEATIRFSDHIELVGYDLSTSDAQPGDTLTLVTAWRLGQPLPDASIFVHVIGPDGRPVAQADGLGAPGESWVAGDVLLQRHTVALPEDIPPDEYPVTVGVYTTSDGRRLTTEAGEEVVALATVTVRDE